MEQQVLAWIAQYGYAAIFFLLVLGIVGLPVPDETLLTFTGYLVYKGTLTLPLAFTAAAGGSACGITISYWLGRTFGLALIHRYGKYFRIRPDHLERAQAFFAHAGHWSLTFGYYVPGVRHFTAFAAGMSQLPMPQFSLFAYIGAAIWASSFIALGYFLGERWEAVQKDLEHYFGILTIITAILLAAYVVWRRWRRRRRK
jgi:membrane protein DedA with SNARE-associated domain